MIRIDEILSVSINKELNRKIRKESKKRKLSASEFVRIAVQSFFDQKQTA